METTIAIMIADLSGFTAMTEIHGAGMAAEMVNRYVHLVKSSLKGESFMLERAGDQVVVISPDPDDLAVTALSLFASSVREKHFLAIHAGLHYGNVLEMDGRYYGSTINLAARIASQAKVGKILCSQDFIDALSNTEAFRYEFHGRFNFKNVLEAKEIVELLPLQKEKAFEHYLCPVCHMQLGATENNFQHIHADKTYYFCSRECNEVFERYQLFQVA